MCLTHFSFYAEWPISQTISLETGGHIKPAKLFGDDFTAGFEVYVRKYKKRKLEKIKVIDKLRYPYKKGYFSGGLRYLQCPLKKSPHEQVQLFGLNVNLGYKLKISRISIDPFIGFIHVRGFMESFKSTEYG